MGENEWFLVENDKENSLRWTFLCEGPIVEPS